jgi:BolA protein
VLDESHMHSRGLQTHFKAVLVSEQFEGLNRVKRHQKVYATLGELMGEFHALALHTYTPEEWAQSTQPRPRRPAPADIDGVTLRIRNAPLSRRVFLHPVHPLRG